MASGEHSSPPAHTAEESCSFILGRYPHGTLMRSREEATDDCVSSVIGPLWPPCHHPGLSLSSDFARGLKERLEG